MKKLLCFFGIHNWWYSDTLDGRLVYPMDGQTRICKRYGKYQRYIAALCFGASDYGWMDPEA